MRFDFLPTQFLTKSQPRLLPVGGGLALVEALARQPKSTARNFVYETTATGLAAGRRRRGRPACVRSGTGARRCEYRGQGCRAGMRRLRRQRRNADALYRPALGLSAAGMPRRLLQQRRRHPHGARHRRRAVRRFRQLSRRAGRSALRHRGAVGVHLSLRHPRQPGRRRFTDEAPGTVDALRSASRARSTTRPTASPMPSSTTQITRHSRITGSALRTDQPPIAGAPSPSSRASSACPPMCSSKPSPTTTPRASDGDVQAAGARRARDARPRPAEIELGARSTSRRFSPIRSSRPTCSPSAA